MKKILLLIGIVVLVLCGGKVYAYMQDCPKGVKGDMVQSSNGVNDYNNTYHHAENYENCNCLNCSRVEETANTE